MNSYEAVCDIWELDVGGSNPSTPTKSYKYLANEPPGRSRAVATQNVAPPDDARPSRRELAAARRDGRLVVRERRRMRADELRSRLEASRAGRTYVGNLNGFRLR
jgi:hypothetical protein